MQPAVSVSQESPRSRVLLWLLLTLVTLSGVEMMSFLFFTRAQERFRFANPEQYTQSPERVRRLHRGYDPDLGWAPAYQTPHGERPRETDYKRPFMSSFGDSHVHGDEVADDETWQTHLARSIEADVFNFGVGGYGPGQALLRYRKIAHRVDTPIVTLGVGLENINRAVNVYRPFYFHKTGLRLTKPRFELREGELVLTPNPIRTPEELVRLSDAEFIHELGAHDFWYATTRARPRLSFPYSALILSPQIWRQAIAQHRPLSDNDPGGRFNLWRNDQARRLFFAIMDAFASEVLGAGAQPVFALQANPTLIQARREGRGIPGYNRVLRLCAERRYDCFDGIAHLTAVTDGQPLDAFFAPGGHASDRGNEVFASGLLQFLEERGMTP